MPKLADVLISVCLGLFIAGGLYFFYLGLKNIMLALASREWPAVTGVVKESRTEQSSARDSKTGTTSTTHSARLNFAYEVGGREYGTGTVFFGQTEGSGDSSEAELLRLTYPEGASVEVFYDPSNPAVAAVKPGMYADALWLPGAGLGFALPGAMFLIMYFSTAHRMGGLGLGVYLFAAIFGMVGVAMLAAGGRNMWLAHVSQSWPLADGEIVYSTGESSDSVSTDEEGTRTRSTTYATRLVYKYEAGGMTRYGNVRRFGQLSGADKEWAAEIAENYPKGRKVRVAYGPADADLSALEPGVFSDAYWIPCIGLAVLLFALAVALIIAPSIGRDSMAVSDEELRILRERFK